MPSQASTPTCWPGSRGRGKSLQATLYMGRCPGGSGGMGKGEGKFFRGALLGTGQKRDTE